ncbi:MAG: FtsX-like permease family protein [Candidatus Acidiferrales bacterium]
MGIPLIGGRYFTQEDSAADAAPVVIISASTAHHLWPGRNSLEETISPVWLPGEKIRVVGIVADTREFTLEKNLPNWIDGEVYVPYGPAAIRANGSKGPLAEMTLVMRTLGGHSDIAPELANVIASLDRDVPPPSDVRTLATIVSGSSAASRSIAWLLGFFGTSALALGALGIYGLISYLVLGRSHEFGVRMALGAQRRDVFRLVLAQGARLSFLGVMLGVIVALIVTRLLESFLYGIGATDPTTFIGAALFLMGVALTASYLPARRATSIYPAVSLRCE